MRLFDEKLDMEVICTIYLRICVNTSTLQYPLNYVLGIIHSIVYSTEH